MLSVCLASFNGGRYIKEQLLSILPQLSKEDEIVVSDDGSLDNTLEIIASIKDDRIKVINNAKGRYIYPFDYVTHNFETALRHCIGDYIFLSDQDDIWLPNKVAMFMDKFLTADLVLSDCLVVDHALNELCPSYFGIVNSREGILKNIYKNSYLGCCMAFKRQVLERALPFPKSSVAHDIWLGLIAEYYFKVELIAIPTLLYRRHSMNISPSGGSSTFPISTRLKIRLKLIISLFEKIFNII